jgi:hypothetical protein
MDESQNESEFEHTVYAVNLKRVLTGEHSVSESLHLNEIHEPRW